jgi:hypothetical protein
LEEFLKAIEGIQYNSNEMKAKFRDILVKSSILKEDDWIVNKYIEILPLL